MAATYSHRARVSTAGGVLAATLARFFQEVDLQPLRDF